MKNGLRLFLILLFFGFAPKSNAQLTESNLPIFRITTITAIVDEPKVEGTLEVFDITNQNNRITDKPIAKYKIGIETRGSTSQQLSEKKPYGFETRTEKGENLNISLLGLPAENDWVLIAPYSDKSLIRDHLSYIFARAMGRYASRTRFVEVIVNNKYHGLYILAEKIKQGKNRVNIANLKATDISGDDLTGGYIVKIDKTSGAPARSWSSNYYSGINKKLFQIEYPKIGDIKEQQFNYIRNIVQDFEARLQSAEFRDLEKGYSKVIDIDSFVDYLLLTELTRNVDGYRLSTYFYKDKDSKGGKLTMGPAWDYNLAFGNADYCDGFKTTGWAFNFGTVCPADGFTLPFWWNRILQDQNFQLKLKSRWTELRKGPLSNNKVLFQVDSATNLLKDASTRNFQQWNIMGRYIWPNYHFQGNYNDEINWMKMWITDRLNWMDQSDLLNPTILSTESAKIDNERPFITPNPINDASKVHFIIQTKQFTEAKILDNKGKIVKTICQQILQPGDYSFAIDGNNLVAGMYIFTLEINHKVANYQKIIVN
jgi:CotH kinase protein